MRDGVWIGGDVVGGADDAGDLGGYPRGHLLKGLKGQTGWSNNLKLIKEQERKEIVRLKTKEAAMRSQKGILKQELEEKLSEKEMLLKKEEGEKESKIKSIKEDFEKQKREILDKTRRQLAKKSKILYDQTQQEKKKLAIALDKQKAGKKLDFYELQLILKHSKDKNKNQ